MKKIGKKPTGSFLRKAWHFVWEEDSLLSWIVNVILAFILIKFVVYPGLGLILGTNYPVVAVVSGSMEHPDPFDDFWKLQHSFYEEKGISKSDFEKFPFKNGFNKGDIIVLKGEKNVQIGEVIVFVSSKVKPKPDPIIHRVIKINESERTYQTKGDNNFVQISGCFADDYCIDEKDISKQQVLGKAYFRIPYFGWVKIAFVEMIGAIRGVI